VDNGMSMIVFGILSNWTIGTEESLNEQQDEVRYCLHVTYETLTNGRGIKSLGYRLQIFWHCIKTVFIPDGHV
jgi:hypothetical protein